MAKYARRNAPRRWYGWRTQGPCSGVELTITRRRHREDDAPEMTDLFYDSARPDLIPDHASVLLYRDGDYAATAEQAKRFARVRWITVIGGVDIAATAGAIDYEPGNACYEKPGLLRAYVGARQAAGHRARIYADRSNVARALEEVAGLRRCWWISTLDGQRRSPVELAADLAHHFEAAVPTGDLWAHQYQGGLHAPYDVSELYGLPW